MIREQSRLGSNRGAARVSLTWLIVVIVFALVALVFAYISQQDLSAARAEADFALRAQQESDTRYEDSLTVSRGLAENLGFYDREGADRTVNTELVQQTIDSLRSDFPGINSEVRDFEEVLPAILSEKRKLVETVDQLRTQIASLEAEIDTVKAAQSNSLSEKNTLIAGLRTQLNDEQANAEERQSELETRLASAEDQVSEIDAQRRAAERTLEEDARVARRKIGTLAARNKSLSDKTAFTRGANVELPDAEVLAVSGKLGQAWINIGTNNRLAVGVTFEIRGPGRPGELEKKADAIVVEVDKTMAKIDITDLRDPFRPVTVGDVLINPVYDATGERYAVLAGNFVGAYSEKELTMLLAEMGIIVQASIDEGTDMLILGTETFVDEFGDPYDTPQQPSDLPVYALAKSLGVAILPYSALRRYISI